MLSPGGKGVQNLQALAAAVHSERADRILGMPVVWRLIKEKNDEFLGSTDDKTRDCGRRPGVARVFMNTKRVCLDTWIAFYELLLIYILFFYLFQVLHSSDAL